MMSYGMEAKEAMGLAYNELLRDKTFLQLQLHSYAAACGDDEIRETTRRGFSRLWDEVVRGAVLGREGHPLDPVPHRHGDVPLHQDTGRGCGDDDRHGYAPLPHNNGARHGELHTLRPRAGQRHHGVTTSAV